MLIEEFAELRSKLDAPPLRFRYHSRTKFERIALNEEDVSRDSWMEKQG